MQNRQALLRNFLFLFIVAVQIAVCIHYAKYKTNLFIDEIWTYNLANNYYNPFVGSAAEYMNRWIDSKFWLQVLSVQPGEEFCYGSVFYNQAQDVHPPLYYMVIHTICSFFPQQFSIWFGIIPNIVFFVGTQFVLLKISDKLFDSKWIALLTTVIYGFSWGAINSVLFIRMYMMLTFFGVLSFWVHLLLFEYYNQYKKLKINYLAAIFIITICGFLTQYYYLIFAFFLSGIFGLWLLKDKEIKLFTKYAVTVSGGIIASIMIFPAFLDQMFDSYRGKEAIRNLSQMDLWNRLKALLKIVNTDVFGNLLGLILLLFALYCVVKFIKSIVSVSRDELNNKYILNIRFNNLFKIQNNYIIKCTANDLVILGIVLFVSCIFFLIVKIAPFIANRYIYMIYPFLCLLLLKYYYTWFANIIKNKFINACLVLLVVIGSSLNIYQSSNLHFSDAWKNTNKIYSIISNTNQNINGILVSGSKSWWPDISQLLVFSKTNKTMLLEINDFELLIQNLKDSAKTDKSIIVYLGANVKNNKEIINKIIVQTPYKYFKVLDSYHGKTYLFNK